MADTEDMTKKVQEEGDRNEMLIWAAARGLTADVEALVDRGAVPEFRDRRGRQPQHYAASHGHAKILDFLASHGVDLDSEDQTGRSAVHYAAAGGHVDALRLLTGGRCRAWLDATDAADDSALHLAARGGYAAAVQILLEASAKPHLVNKRSLTPLTEALAAGHTAVADVFASRFGDALLDPVGKPNDSAAASGSGQGFRDLVPDTVRRQRFRGYSALHVAAGMGQAASVQWLLKRGADPNDRANPLGLAPLHAAAAAASRDTVEALIRAGADPAALSKAGDAPLDLLPAPGSRPLVSPDEPAASTDPMDIAAAGAPGEKPRKLQAIVMPDISQDTYDAIAKRLKTGSKKRGASSASAAASDSLMGRVFSEAGKAAPPASTGSKSGLLKRSGEASEDLDPTTDPISFSLYFTQLPEDEQRRKVRSLARLAPRQMGEQKHLEAEARAALLAAADAAHVLSCFSAVAALRADASFQEPLLDEKVRRAIARQQRKLSGDPPGAEGEEPDGALLDKLSHSGEVQAVVAKLRRLYAVFSQGAPSPEMVPKVDLPTLRGDLPGQGPLESKTRLDELRAAVARREKVAIDEILRVARPLLQEQAPSAPDTPSAVSAPTASVAGASPAAVGAGGSQANSVALRAQRRDKALESEIQPGSPAEAPNDSASLPSTPVEEKEEYSKGYPTPDVSYGRALYGKCWRWYGSQSPEVQRSLHFFLQGLMSLLLSLVVLWILGMAPNQLIQEARRMAGGGAVTAGAAEAEAQGGDDFDF